MKRELEANAPSGWRMRYSKKILLVSSRRTSPPREVQRERGGKKKAEERGLMPESMQEFHDDKYPEPVEEGEADPKADKGKAKDDKGKKGKNEPEEEELPVLQERLDDENVSDHGTLSE